MRNQKTIDWTIVIVVGVMCFAFGAVEVIEANDISTDEFRRWFASLSIGGAGIGAYKILRRQGA